AHKVFTQELQKHFVDSNSSPHASIGIVGDEEGQEELSRLSLRTCDEGGSSWGTCSRFPRIVYQSIRILVIPPLIAR
ncbi:unnamed protein product, partial [Pleuronectes platessa]